MRKGNRGPILAKIADGDIKAYRVVKLTADGKVKQATAAAADVVFGVADRDAKDGETVDVHIYGLVTVDSGAAVAVGGLLKSDADGKAITAAAAGDLYFGMAHTVSAAEDDRIDVQLAPGKVYV